jgi:uncharacterized membrane protein YfcA
MDIYFPIADISVFAPLILGLAFIVGIISGLLGIGGGFILTPILIFMGIPSLVAVGSCVSQVFASSAYAVSHYHKNKVIPYKTAAIFVFGGLIGAVLGVKTLHYLSIFDTLDMIIKCAFLCLLCIVFILLMLPTPHDHKHKCPTNISQKQMISLLIFGINIGFISGFIGVSGGIIAIPAFMYFLHFNRKNAQILSQVNTVFVSMIGLMLHFFMNNNIDPVLCGILIIGGFSGSFFGVRLSQKIPNQFSHYLFICIVLSTIIIIIYDLL